MGFSKFLGWSMIFQIISWPYTWGIHGFEKRNRWRCVIFHPQKGIMNDNDHRFEGCGSTLKSRSTANQWLGRLGFWLSAIFPQGLDCPMFADVCRHGDLDWQVLDWLTRFLKPMVESAPTWTLCWSTRGSEASSISSTRLIIYPLVN